MTLKIKLLLTAMITSLVNLHGNTFNIYPKPHSVKSTGNGITLSHCKLVNGSQADKAAVSALKKVLSPVSIGSKGLPIIIGEIRDKAIKKFSGEVKKTSGAYYLSVNNSRIIIAGFDGAGTFYGVQTLRQILRKRGKNFSCPNVEISDYPDTAFRGVVEGFYGTPENKWNHRDRISLIKFFGSVKMNNYIYGPKDDPYHRSKWREAYPESELKKMKELVELSKANKVKFTWAIHPGGNIRWIQEDRDAIMKKFEAMYQVGVRSFNVFFDDISGKEQSRADKQAELLNYLNKNFIKVKGDCDPLIMCPTQYNRGWSGGDYLDVLGNTLDKDIHVMWTGDTVVNDITLAGQKWINNRLKRPAYIWYNWPCNDYVRRRLVMGRFYNSGQEPEMLNAFSGFTANPMGQAEASKVGLFGVADYTWNIINFDSNKAWQASFKAIMPECADAFAKYCLHSSSLGPNYHRYAREEAVEFKPIIDQFFNEYSKGKIDKDRFKQVYNEYKSFGLAIKTIEKKAKNRKLVDEMTPWLKVGAQVSLAGTAVVEMAKFQIEKDDKNFWIAYAKAETAFSQMENLNRTLNQNPWQPGIEVGAEVLVPYAKKIYQQASANFYEKVAGEAIIPEKLTASFPFNGDKNSFTNPTNWVESKEKVGPGSTVTLNLGKRKSIAKVLVTMRNHPNHYAKKAQLEYSSDNQKWLPFGETVTGYRTEVSVTKPVKAQYIRYRIVEGNVKLAVCFFAINYAEQFPSFTTNKPDLSSQPIQAGNNSIIVTPKFEPIPLNSGQYFGIRLMDGVAATKVTVDLKSVKTSDVGQVEASIDGVKWQKLNSTNKGTALIATVADKALKQFRFVCKKSSDSIYFNTFTVNTKPIKGAGNKLAAIDGKLDTSFITTLSKPVTIPSNNGNAKNVTVLMSSKSKRPLVAFARDGLGKRVKLGIIRDGFGTFRLTSLKKPIKAIEIGSAKYPVEVKVNEIIWSNK